jgi:hypothetical protein
MLDDEDETDSRKKAQKTQKKDGNIHHRDVGST